MGSEHPPAPNRYTGMSIATRKSIASNPRTSPDVLARLVHTEPIHEMTLRIAGNPNCSAQTLTKLAKGSRQERWLAAEHPNTPDRTLRDLTWDTDDIRWIAEATQVYRHNPERWGPWLQENHHRDYQYEDIPHATPRTWLAYRAQNAVDRLNALQILCHRRADATTAIEMIRSHTGSPHHDFSSTDAASAALGSGIKLSAINMLTIDSMTSVEIYGQYIHLMGEELAEHRDCPGDLLVTLGTVTDTLTRAMVARNVRTPAGTLGLLIKDSSYTVRYRAMHNPSLPGYLRALCSVVPESPEALIDSF